MRQDFATIGALLIVIGLLLLVLAIANDAVVRIIRSSASWFLALGILACIAGLVYFFAGMLRQSTTTASPSVEAPQPEPQVEEQASTQTGPGWHCTWCWSPLPEGSKFCTNCGRKIS